MRASEGSLIPIRKMLERIEDTRSKESATTLFLDLSLLAEMVLKLTTAGMVAALRDESAADREEKLYNIVRANGLDPWVTAVKQIVAGKNESVIAGSLREKQELSRTCTRSSWQYRAAQSLHLCLRTAGLPYDELLDSVQGYEWLEWIKELRDKYRHGAFRDSTYAAMYPHLEEALSAIIDNFSLFKRPWAYLHRTYTGSYRVTHLSDSAESIKATEALIADHPRAQALDGAYIIWGELGRPVPSAGNAGSGQQDEATSRRGTTDLSKVDLMWSDEQADDFLFPNGHFNRATSTFDLLSYITGSVAEGRGSIYKRRRGHLPSETEGAGELVEQGRVLSNMPPAPTNYVHRQRLEKQLLTQLQDTERTPIITLGGMGGIGKTSLARAVLHGIAAENAFDCIVWFSARNIDLRPEGPREVRQRVRTLDEIAREYLYLTDSDRDAKRLNMGRTRFMEECLRTTKLNGTTLFVFDNFETVAQQAELYEWLRMNVLPPNKVLITTRCSSFKGDYDIEISGMDEQECDELITSTAEAWGITSLIDQRYRQALYEESDGHPYVVKILLGEVAKAGKPMKVRRILAARDNILEALFERIFEELSTPAKTAFLTLCSTRSLTPAFALEAALTAGSPNRLAVDRAVRELQQSSLIELVAAEESHTLTTAYALEFYNVPLAAYLFGERVLKLHQHQHDVEPARRLLQLFGTFGRKDRDKGQGAIIDDLMDNVVAALAVNPEALSDYTPLLEFLAASDHRLWIFLAELSQQHEGSGRGEKMAERYLQSCLQRTLPEQYAVREQAWRGLEDIYRLRHDVANLVNVLIDLCAEDRIPNTTLNTSLKKVNGLLSQCQLPSHERKRLLTRVVAIGDRKKGWLKPSDLSRLAWLCKTLGGTEKAKEFVLLGLKRDADHIHCRRLAQSLRISKYVIDQALAS